MPDFRQVVKEYSIPIEGGTPTMAKRRRFTLAFKARVALEALSEARPCRSWRQSIRCIRTK